MQELPDAQKTRILQALQERGALRECPRCGNQSFTLLGGYFNQGVQTDVTGLTLGGPSVPSVVVVCERCGFLS